MQSSIFILLGSNLGDRNSHLNYARQEISRLAGDIITVSSVYKTDAWGNTEQPAFFNQVIEIQSNLTPKELLFTILKIEKNAGRVREAKWGPRVLDLDILFFGDTILVSDDLTIPHPQIANRRFTLLPLAEIASTFIHPVTRLTMDKMLQLCTDNLMVKKIQSEG
jgi:2-amino-4-hydroxy-6-hydroxymethyldihydropteridine diphosphokinase